MDEQGNSCRSDAEMEEGYRILRYEKANRVEGLKLPVLRELARMTGSVPFGGPAKKVARDLLVYVSI